MRASALWVAFLLSGNAATAKGADTTHIYILAGQSNAGGYGWAPDLASADLAAPQADVLFSFNLESNDNFGWRVSNGFIPLQGGYGAYRLGEAGYTTAQFGIEVTFGRTIASLDPDKAFGIIKIAQGGSGLDTRWRIDGGSSGEGLYQRMVSYVNAQAQLLINQGKTVVFDGLIWAQGEADATSTVTADKYETNLRALIAQLRSDLASPNLKVLIPRLSANQTYLTDSSGALTAGMQTVRQAALNLAATDPLVQWIDTDMLSVRKDDRIHFNGSALMNIGEQLAYLALGVPQPQFAVPPRNVVFTTSTSSQTTAYPASTSDLINAGSPALDSLIVTDFTPSASQGFVAGLSNINNGTNGSLSWPTPGANGEVTTDVNFWNMNVDLNLTEAPNGYDITSIDGIAGWIGPGRLSQTFNLYFSHVGQAGWTFVDRYSHTPATGFSGSSKLTISGIAGQPIGSNVDAILFEFVDPNPLVNNTEPAWREIDIFGSASADPSPVPSALREWRFRNFGNSPVPGVTGDLDDPDADGLPNLMEYATGSFATVTGSGAVPLKILSPSAGGCELTFRRRTVPDVAYIVETSTTIAGWEAISALLSSENPVWDPAEDVQVVEEVSTIQTTLVRVLFPASSDPTRFFRVRVVR